MTVIGTASIRDWDAGCFKTLGASVETYDVDGDTRSIYVVDVSEVDSGFSSIGGKIPCQFVDPEDVFQNFRIPCYQFRRNDMTPAFDRHAWYQFVDRGPSKDAERIVLSDGTVGYSKYENQWRATQFDITYDCNVIARRQQESVPMMMYALKHFIPPWFVFKIVDSLGEVREYDAGEMSISNTSELIDIAERVVSWTISFTVRAEIDLHDERVYPAMTEPDVTYSKFNPD